MHEVLRMKPSTLQDRQSACVVYFGVYDFPCLFCETSPLSQKYVRGIFSALGRVPQFERHSWYAEGLRWKNIGRICAMV